MVLTKTHHFTQITNQSDFNTCCDFRKDILTTVIRDLTGDDKDLQIAALKFIPNVPNRLLLVRIVCFSLPVRKNLY
jgi:hypothetical protein